MYVCSSIRSDPEGLDALTELGALQNLGDLEGFLIVSWNRGAGNEPPDISLKSEPLFPLEAKVVVSLGERLPRDTPLFVKVQDFIFL